MTVETWLDLASFLGIACLSVPVLSLDGRKRKLTQIGDIVARRKRSGDRRALDDIAKKVREEHSEDVARWRPIDRACLWGGYVMLFGSSLARLLV